MEKEEGDGGIGVEIPGKNFSLQSGRLMNVLSFISANYVARETGYHMPGGWMEGDAATNAWFSEPCVKTAVRDGFTGPVPFEHEPEAFDPNEDARVSLARIKSWL